MVIAFMLYRMKAIVKALAGRRGHLLDTCRYRNIMAMAPKWPPLTSSTRSPRPTATRSGRSGDGGEAGRSRRPTAADATACPTSSGAQRRWPVKCPEGRRPSPTGARASAAPNDWLRNRAGRNARLDRLDEYLGDLRERRKAMTMTRHGSATVAFPSDSEALITRKFDASASSSSIAHEARAREPVVHRRGSGSRGL